MTASLLKSYFYEGFVRANKSLDVYSFGLLFYLPLVIIPTTVVNSLSFVVTVVFLYFSLVYSLSLAWLLTSKQKNSRLSWRNALFEMVRNAKRMLLQSFLLFLGLLVMMFIGMIIVFLTLGPVWFTENSYLKPGLTVFNVIFYALFSLIASSLTFATIFFSLKNHSLVQSLLQSISYSNSNRLFLAAVFAVNFLMFLVNSMFQSLEPVLQAAQLLVTHYASLVIASSALIYFNVSKSK